MFQTEILSENLWENNLPSHRNPHTYCDAWTVRLGMQTLSGPHSFWMEMESEVIVSNCPSTGISSLRRRPEEEATLEPVSEYLT